MPKKQPKLIGLLDMDGTLCDHNGAFREALKPFIETFNVDPKKCPKFLKDLVRSQPGFWRNLKPLELGMDIVNLLREHNFCLNVLTKGPSRTSIAWKEKMEWCREHMPDAAVTVTEDKSLTYGKILVDDWPRYAIEWLDNRPRGLVLMPAHEYNADFSHPQVVHVYEDKRNWDEIKERVQQVVDRTLAQRV